MCLGIKVFEWAKAINFSMQASHVKTNIDIWERDYTHRLNHHHMNCHLPDTHTRARACKEEGVCEVTVEEIDSNFMNCGCTAKDGEKCLMDKC